MPQRITKFNKINKKLIYVIKNVYAYNKDGNKFKKYIVSVHMFLNESFNLKLFDISKKIKHLSQNSNLKLM